MAVSMALFTSCSSDGPENEHAAKADITGCWELTDITTKSAVIGDQTVDVYLMFDSGYFEIYQRTGTTERYYRFEGTYTFDGTTLSGVYSDKREWSVSYTVSVTDSQLTLSSGIETDTYRKISSIPDGILY